MRLYTSNYIFDESVTLIRAKLGFDEDFERMRYMVL
jgi:hypothetical protein